jgi:hypothetical protein
LLPAPHPGTLSVTRRDCPSPEAGDAPLPGCCRNEAQVGGLRRRAGRRTGVRRAAGVGDAGKDAKKAPFPPVSFRRV